MSFNKNKLDTYIAYLFYGIAFIIILDFIIPGTVINSTIKDIVAKRENYNNAAQNYHYSYKVITENNEFSVSEKYSEVKPNSLISYSVSRIFKKINWYKLKKSEIKTTYSLRYFSGLIIPLIAIIALFFAYKLKKDIAMFLFIVKVLLLGNLVFLIY